MRYKCNVNLKSLQDIDLFSRRLELYYNGKPEKTSRIGTIFTLIYVSIFLTIILYKLIKMLEKQNGTFYITYEYQKEPPSIKLTNENFYGGFALENPETYDEFIDETIYYPKAYYKRAERHGNKWEWLVKEIELEKCQIEKFSPIHREKFKGKELNNLYCFKEINETLMGHYSYDNYSLFFISLFPCVNNTENNKHCKPLEVIDYYLKGTFVSIQMQDIELTPQNYDFPYIATAKDIYYTIGKKLFQEVQIFFQIVKVETDTDIIGFTDFQSFKTEKLLKYDSMNVMSNIIENNIYETGESFCNITLKLSNNILTQRRTYIKLFDILGNIGGLMEVIFSLLKIVSSFSTKIIYEESLVNNLFEFNLNKKAILINNKERNYVLKNKFSFQQIPSKRVLTKPINSSMNLFTNAEDRISQSNNRNNEDIMNISKMNNDNLLVINSSKRKNGNTLMIEKSENENSKNNIIQNNEFNSRIYYKSDKNVCSFMNYKEEIENESPKRKLISEIKINRACLYICFFYVRRRKNLQNILLNEGMKLIIEKLDLLNLFRTIYRDEKIHLKIKNEDLINMSKMCKKNLEVMYKTLYF
jgi:hypothetical protein